MRPSTYRLAETCGRCAFCDLHGKCEKWDEFVDEDCVCDEFENNI